MRRLGEILIAVIATTGCEAGSDSSESMNAPRCAALCDEDACGGESRDRCIDECVAEAEGLESSCVQCLIDHSDLTIRRDLGNGEYCYPLADRPWGICDEAGLNCRPADDACDDDTLPQSCVLNFGSTSDCTDSCSE